MHKYEGSYKIIWQKWADPFGQDDIDETIDSFIEEDETEFMAESEKSIESNKIVNQQYIRVMATPMGIMPINENTASNKIFNFWLGHTNFDITKKIVSVIEDISGVEALDIFTRYRFRIAVGKAFNDSKVMRSINDQVYKYLDENNVSSS